MRDIRTEMGYAEKSADLFQKPIRRMFILPRFAAEKSATKILSGVKFNEYRCLEGVYYSGDTALPSS